MYELFFDCETLPVIDEAKAKVFDERIKPPGQYKKPESIKAWLEDPANIKQARSKTALDGAWGRLCCIAYAIGDGSIDHIYDKDERKMLEAFKEVVVEKNKTPRHLVGQYIKGFDLPFIHKRMLIHGMGPLFGFDTKPWEMNASCVGTMFSLDPRNISNLDTLCCAFDVKSPKTDEMDGSKVYDAYLAGEIEKIIEYNKDDVRAVREIYYKMVPPSA